MDVTSLMFAFVLAGQAVAGDRYPQYNSPGSANLSPPAVAPSYSPSAVPPDPIFTAAAPKKPAAPAAPLPTDYPPRNPSPSSGGPATYPPSGPSNNTVAPMATPVPSTPPAPLGNATKNPTTVGATAPGVANASVPQTFPESGPAFELIRGALAAQPDAPPGRPRTLFDTLSTLGDRRRQLAAIVAYWKLAAETAEYNYDRQQLRLWEQLQGTVAQRGADQATSAEVAVRLAAAQARVREGELRLHDAQWELMQLSWQADDSSRPLTVDLPHTGSYKTQFERLFAGGAAPPRAVLLNRTLPLRQQVVGMRAEAAVAAHNAYEQTFAAFQSGRLSADEAAAALDDLRRRRSEFIVAVRRYNEEIAEYALTAAPDGVGAATLVDMLIKNGVKPAVNTVSEDFTPRFDDEVTPATFIESPTGTPTLAPPLVAPTPDPISAPSASMPVPAPSAVPAYLNSNASPTAFAASSDTAPLTPGAVPPPITPEMERPYETTGGALPVANARGANPLRGEPTLAPPPNTATTGTVYPPSNPLPPAMTTSPGSVVPATATNPYSTPAAGTASAASPSPPGLLPPFVPQQSQPAPLPQTRYRVHTTNYQSAPSTGMTRAQATQELVEAIYGAAEAPVKGEAVQLGDCLTAAPEARPRVLAAYWSAAEQRARYVVWSQAMETMRPLASQPHVQAAVAGAEAERTEALLTLETARWRLSDDLQVPLDRPWLLPTTLPHGGGYRIKLTAPATLPQVRRAAERIPLLHETLQSQASAVMATERTAESAIARFNSQSATPRDVLEAVERKANETCELLNTTTRYNLAIADYALGVIPATAPESTLLGALIIERNAVASRR